MVKTVTLLNDDGDEIEVKFPAKYEVCDRCEGKGKHVNPAIDGNGLSREDFDEAGPEFFEDYMSGVYDVTCYECKGERVVLVIDEDAVERDPALKAHFADYLDELDAIAASYRESEMERKMGA
jgi:hypothetical protein